MAKFVLKILFFSFFGACAKPLLAQDIFPADSAVLLQIYAQCNGANWTRKWNLAESATKWEGVKIDPNTKRVFSIELPNNNLQGNLPPQIANLTALQILNLENNRLAGQIPDFAPNQTVFHTLILGKNNFAGSIPAAWQSLPLQVIDLSQNQFVGSLPLFFQNMPFLRSLDLSGNRFVGTLSGFLDNWQNLQVLRLANNELNGSLPSVLYQRTSLVELDLSNNQFESRLEDQLANLVNLQVFKIANNRFFDFLTGGISNLRLLRIVDISNNRFISLLPADISRLRNLEYLNMSNNAFQAGFPSIIAPNLYYFNVSNNRFQSNLPQLDLFGNLQFVDISHNSFIGGFSASYASAMQKCTFINFSNNAIGGSLPENISLLQNLAFLNLSNNLFAGKLPQGLGELANLKELLLNNNRLIGEFPNVEKLKKLRTLLLDQNFLNFLPNLKLQTPQLQRLSLENNRFDFGDLEPQIGLPNLTYIPQDSIRIPRFCYLDAHAGGQNTVYKWFKDNKPIPNSNIPIWTVLESGEYYAQITNSVVRGLVFRTPTVSTSETTPIIDLGADQEYRCGELDIQLSVGEIRADRFLWNTGDTVRNIRVRRGGTYKVRLQRGQCIFEDSLKINYRGISDNEITANQSLCTGGTPKPLIGKLSAINISPKYFWQKSVDRQKWVNIDTTENYMPPALVSQTYYRRLVSTVECGTDTSNTVLVQVSNIQAAHRVQNITCAGLQNGEIDLQISGGLEPYRVRWSNGQNTPRITNLLPQKYEVSLEDRIGCKRNFAFEITEPTPLVLTNEVVQASCSNLAEGGKISLKISGGTPPYRISWNSGHNSFELLNIQIGNYEAQIRDANDCEIRFTTKISPSRPDDSRFSYPFQNYCTEEPKPKATILGQKGGKFKAEPEGLSLDANTGEINLAASQAGKYLLVYELNACSSSSLPIEIQGNCKDLIPNTITPNGDTYNDIWEILFLERYPNSTVKIINRWGNTLFESKGYDQPFNGTSYGTELPFGAYFYLIELPSGQVIKGSLSIVR